MLPDILAVVQVALEGNVSKRSAVNSLARGELPQVRRGQIRIRAFILLVVFFVVQIASGMEEVCRGVMGLN